MGAKVIWKGMYARLTCSGVSGLALRGYGRMTYKCLAFPGRLGARSWEEGGNAVGQPVLRQGSAAGDRRIAIVGRILDEDEDENNRSTHGAEGPPEDIVPRVVLGDKASQGSTADDGEDD